MTQQKRPGQCWGFQVSEFSEDQYLAQSNPGGQHGPHPSVILGHKLRIFLACFLPQQSAPEQNKVLLDRSRLSSPGEYHARRNPVATCDLGHLCARHQRLFDDPHLAVMHPAPPSLHPAQYLDPHRLMTSELDLRSHAPQNIPVKQGGARRMRTFI
jgi:hypothetical protein